jgi:uncharacterized lipoprotein YajG
MPILRRCIPLLLLLVLAGCARGMEIGSPSPADTFSIDVENSTGVTMVVTYDDGRGTATLGTVSAGRTERFIIAAPANLSVTVRGEAISRTRRAGPYRVTLVAGTPQIVRLR